MSVVGTAYRNQGIGQTQRRDAWWLEPLLTLLGLSAFGAYATWAAFQGTNYEWGAYLSPFYSPDLPHWFPEQFGWWKFSPAFLILPFPMIFRATCYYYRKAYYRSFFTSPPACTADMKPLAKSPLGWLLGQGKNYTGERAFPMVIQNIHRYAFYIAAIFIFILGYDALHSFFGWQDGFHVGIGSLVLSANVALLAMYTFGCHSWRHLIGGNLDCFSCENFGKERHQAWSRQSILNYYHMQFAWLSLFSVGFADFYVRMVASGVITDIRLF